MASYAALTVTGLGTGTSTWGNNVRDHLVIQCTSATRPGSAHEGMTIYETDTNNYAVYDGSAWGYTMGSGAWTSYTPFFVGVTSSLSYGNGSRSGGYRYISGRTVEFWALFVWGTTTSSTGAWTGMRVELPVNMATHWQYQVGNSIKCTLFDATGLTYPGDCLYNSVANEVLLGFFPAAGTNLYRNTVTSTDPVTWATNDYWAVHGTYEATS